MTVSRPPTTPANLRDVGGLPRAGGGTVRTGVLLRSEAPLPGDRLPVVPSAVLDLRHEAELRGLPHPLAGTAEVHSVPLGASLAPEAVAAGTPAPVRDLAWAYRRLVTEAAGELARIVRILAHAPAPVLVHCAAGKDRTGIVIATALRLVDVPREHVLADYLRTNDTLDELWARLEASGHRVPPEAQGLRGVDAAALEAVLDELDAHPAGVRGHLESHGSDPRDLDALVARLT